MRYVIGIDGGGTKLQARAAALDGSHIAEHTGPSSSHYFYGEDWAVSSTLANLEALISKFGGRLSDCAALVCGTTGIDSPEDQRTVERIYSRLGLSCPYRVFNDVELALRATVGQYGAVVIAGTGSIAFGRSTSGLETRTGGWGTGIGSDRGSGVDLTNRALELVSRYHDGIAPRGPLVSSILDGYGMTVDELVTTIRKIKHEDLRLPGIPPLIGEAADSGDVEALSILEYAADELFWLADRTIGKLSLDRDGPLVVGAWGSVLLKNARIFKGFEDRLSSKYPTLEVKRPVGDAAQAAASMALLLAD